MKNIVETTIFMLVMIYALTKGCVSKEDSPCLVYHKLTQI